jgi:Ca-activated chloride channel family protein
VLWYVLQHAKVHAHLKISGQQLLPRTKSIKLYLRHSLFALRMLSLAALVVAMARPQSSSSWQDVSTEGIDIVLALDISGSMLAEDFEPNRLEAAKIVAQDFIEGRPNDRIGLVVYSGESFTQCPLTTDHSVLKNLFMQIKNGMIEDGTAIGLGLANAVTRLKDSDAKSKVVILLTDGINNRGSIPPITAAEIAKAFDVRVYTIGMGTYGTAPMPFQHPYGGTHYQNVEVKIDENTLTEIASLTGGKYFRATDNEKLSEIYSEIDQLEKSKIEVTEYRKKKEEYTPWLVIALSLLGLEFLLRNTYFKSVF